MPDIFTNNNKASTSQENESEKATDSNKQNKHSQNASEIPQHQDNEHEDHPKKYNKMGIFTAICEYPKNVNFINKDNDEVIIVFVRRHFITNLTWIIPSIIAIFIPPLIAFILNKTAVEFLTIPSGIIAALLIFYYLITVGYVFTSFLSWFFNIGIVTQKRMVDIDYNNILHKNISSVHHSEIVDLEFVQRGFFQSLFNYGDILVQTEGVKPNFEFHAAPEPAHVVDIIHDILAKSRANR